MRKSQGIGKIPLVLQHGAHDILADDLGLDSDMRPLPWSPLVDTGEDVGATDDFNDAYNSASPEARFAAVISTVTTATR